MRRLALLSTIVCLAFSVLLTGTMSAQGTKKSGTTNTMIPLCLSGCGGGGVAVTFSPTSLAEHAHEMSQFTTFFVKNNESTSDVFALSCTATGPVSCDSLKPTSVALSAGEQLDFGLYFSTKDSSGTAGRITITATGEHATGWGALPITVTGSRVVVVSPGTSPSRLVVHTRQPLLRALFKLGSGEATDTAATLVTWRGANVTALIRQNRGLLEWEVDSAHRLGIGDSAQWAVQQCTTSGVCTSETRWVVLPNDSTPVVDFTGMPLEALGAGFSASFGPGFAVNGAEVETGFGTVPYFDLGAARSTGLAYSTRTSYPRALVPVNVELPWPSGTPTQIKAVLFDGATRLDSVTIASPSCLTGSVHQCRLVLQGDFSASTFSTPVRKWLIVQVAVTSGTTKTTTDSTEVVLVDRRATRYGAGWWPSAFSEMFGAGNDRILVAPNGTGTIYRGNGDSLYLPPPGATTVLVKTSTGWELHPRATTAKVVFDASGRLSKTVDQNGNRDSLLYSGATDQLDSIIDPLGKVIRFTYTGAGKLSTITSLYGATGARATAVLIDTATNQLTYDSLSTPASRPATARYAYQGYGANKTALIVKRIGVLADTTALVYDSTFKRRPVQVKLPATPDTTSIPQVATLTYAAYAAQGYHALRSRDSVYVEMRDPRSHWTRALLNRWGETLQGWDSLGMLGKATYTADGLALTAEGKNGDSSRVYTAYDARNRVVKTYIVRSSTDTLRVDSLVYDASDRLIKTINSLGQSDSVGYDAAGNPDYVRDPQGNVTQTWYHANGLVDSVLVPSSTGKLIRKYDATWQNLLKVTDQTGAVADSVLYDAYGRDTTHLSKIRVQVTQDSTTWQWRKNLTYYNIANQSDSVAVRHSVGCADPCNSPPVFKPFDRRTVRYTYDRAGRDSLRVDPTGATTVYFYDKLSRLIVRRPWSDSSAVRDSMVYDIAGNLVKHSTRRGDLITSMFDSRNRDTLTTVPGIGKYERVYGGPQDQLTQLKINNYVDSIGGVNPNHSWGYDQRGRLVADTTFFGSTAKVTTYTYDTYERPHTFTDPLGTWTTRYETSRGIADTLLSPLGDTLGLVLDDQGRVNNASLHTGGASGFAYPVGYTGAGDVNSISMTGVSSGFNPGSWQAATPEDGDNLGVYVRPTWSQQDTAGAHTMVYGDSVTYDGWGRVTSWSLDSGYVDGPDITRHEIRGEAYAFDADGNLINASTSSEMDNYTVDAGTGRLTAWTDTSSSTGRHFSWTPVYDRAGNLAVGTLWTFDGMNSNVTTYSYHYDAYNRLTSVWITTTLGGPNLVARYAYDVLGNRIVKRVYSGSNAVYTRYFPRGAQVGFEADSTGRVWWRYVWGPGVDNLLAVHDSLGHTYYPVKDNLHSIRGWVTSLGKRVTSQRFSPYGDSLSAVGTDLGIPYGWADREYDQETGFYYLRARYYSPGLRRFVQEDPMGYGGGSNLYAYVDGSVLSATDPSGNTKMVPSMADLASLMAAELIPGEADGRLDAMFNAQILAGGGGSGWGGGNLYVWGDFTEWDLMTDAEKYDTGKMKFASKGEEDAYLSLKQRAYETDDASLIYLTDQAARRGVSVADVAGDPRGGPFSDVTTNTVYMPQGIAVESAMFHTIGAVLLAHELGHIINVPWGVVNSIVYTAPNGYQEPYNGMYYENLARSVFGCAQRPQYDGLPPACE